MRGAALLHDRTAVCTAVSGASASRAEALINQADSLRKLREAASYMHESFWSMLVRSSP